MNRYCLATTFQKHAAKVVINHENQQEETLNNANTLKGREKCMINLAVNAFFCIFANRNESRQMHIAIAGNIGSGKSSLTQLLARHYGWEPRYEVVEGNPYLEDYYRDIHRWSYNRGTTCPLYVANQIIGSYFSIV